MIVADSMKKRLTKRTIDALEPTNKMFKVWDTDVKGFFLRVMPSGTKTFAVFYRIDGKGRDYTIGHYGRLTPEQASRIAKSKLAEVSAGTDIQESKKASVKAAERHKYSTLKGFIELKYADWALSHLRGAKEQLRVLEIDFADYHARPMEKITKWDITVWQKRARAAGLKVTTINRRVAILKSVLAKAVEWDVIENSPIAGMARLKTDEAPHVRYLGSGEEAALRAALAARQESQRDERNKHNSWLEKRHKQLLPDLNGVFTDYLMPMVLLALNTGMRRGELFKLEWQDVQLKERNIIIHGYKSKSGSTRHIPMNDEAFQVLVTWRNISSEDRLVFPSPQTGRELDNISTSWKNVIEKSGISNFRFHDLRHTFASKLVMAGVDLNTVRELLGHSDLKMTLIYAHLAPEHKAAAVAMLNKI
ncbi:Tyrosine recombinase XerC [Thalassocella blandensis]|nr:Tyrosine recombinase XerC [Thalassocella blandensis]